MALNGDLKNMPLADILQSLKANTQTGTLSLHDGKKDLHLFFRRELIVHVSPGAPSEAYLNQILLARFELTDDRLQKEIAKRGKRSIAQQLQKARLADIDTITRLHALYLSEYLYDAFAWKKGSFEFTESAQPGVPFDADQISIELNMPIEQIILEAMRRVDEWKQIRKVVPTLDDVFVVSDLFKSQVVQVTEPATSILGMCDGEHSASQISYALGIDHLTVASVIAHHLKTNYLRRVRAEDFTAMAERHLEKGDTAGALKFLKRSVETDGSNIEVRAQYAEQCRAAGSLADASSEYKTLAQMAREREDYARARAYYETLIEMNPSEFQIQQRLHEMLREQQDPDTTAAGLALAATYQRLELRAERAALLRSMSDTREAGSDVFEQLGDAETALGQLPQASAAFAQAGRLYAESGRIQQACAMYEKALLAAPDDSRVARVLEDLRTGAFLARRARRRRILALSGASLIVLATIAYAVYNAVAVHAWLSVRNANLEHLANGEIEVVQSRIDRFGDAFPFSLVLFDRAAYRARVRLLFDAQQAAVEKAVSAELATIESDSTETADSSIVVQ